MAFTFVPATITTTKARLAFSGVSGSGKTYTALATARALAGENGRIAVIDTESGSASKYAPFFKFDVLELDNFDPLNYIAAMDAAAKAGYDVIVIDSLSHAWAGKGGLLEQHTEAERKIKNGYAAWRELTPVHNQLVDAIIRSPMHVICTMRVKEAYEITKDDSSGKTRVSKLGLEAVQRAGISYEFDMLVDLDTDHYAIVSKSRFPSIDGKQYKRPGSEIGLAVAEALGGLQSRPLTYTPATEVAAVTTPSEASTDDSSGESEGWREKIEASAARGFFAVAALKEEIDALTPAPYRANVLRHYFKALAEATPAAIENCASLADLTELKPFITDIPATVKIGGETVTLDRAGIFAQANAKKQALTEGF